MEGASRTHSPASNRNPQSLLRGVSLYARGYRRHHARIPYGDRSRVARPDGASTDCRRRNSRTGGDRYPTSDARRCRSGHGHLHWCLGYLIASLRRKYIATPKNTSEMIAISSQTAERRIKRSISFSTYCAGHSLEEPKIG